MLSAVETVDARKELAQLEARAEYLRATLPPLVKRFFRFRVQPGARFRIVYAPDREAAEAKLRAELEATYGNGFQVFPVVDEFADPRDAAVNCGQGSNLLDCLSRADADEFLSDWRADQRGREKSSGRQSQLERDIAMYEFKRREKARQR